jgi:hypothetical protein
MTDKALELALQSIESAGPKLVVVGGTAHRFFPEHELGHDPGFELLTTEDIDLAASLELQADGSDALLRHLQAAGFREEVEGVDDASYSYRLEHGDGAYLQFLAPRMGDGTRRRGRSVHVVRVSGVQAERLRDIDLLLHRPWQISLQVGKSTGRLWVANPSAYLVQKLLTLEHRRGRKRAKDLLYVFDTLAIFADGLEALASRVGDLLPEVRRGTLLRLTRAVNEQCFRETDISREAAAIAAAQRRSPPSSSQIVSACRQALPLVLNGLILGA